MAHLERASLREDKDLLDRKKLHTEFDSQSYEQGSVILVTFSPHELDHHSYNQPDLCCS